MSQIKHSQAPYDPFDPSSSQGKLNDDEVADSKEEQRMKGKGNTKNTYIKKISSLMKIINHENPSLDNQGHHVGRSIQKKVQSQLAMDQLNGLRDGDKLAKNRESARNSRKRKKIYLELLESKVTNLSEQLEKYKKVYEKNQELAINLQSKINIRREQEHSKLILFNNMQNAIQSNTSENNIDSIIESLSKKFGSGSYERTVQLEHFTKQIVDNSLSQHSSYLILSAKTNTDLFQTTNHEEQNLVYHLLLKRDPANSLIRRLGLTDKQRQQLLKKKSKLLKSYADMANSLQQVQESKSNIQGELSQLAQTLELLRRELKPSQVARFLLAIEKKDIQGQYKESFERYFGSGDGLDEDDSLDLYQFMSEHNVCNSLGIDVMQAYEVYRRSNDFLQGKYEEKKNSFQNSSEKLEN